MKEEQSAVRVIKTVEDHVDIKPALFFPPLPVVITRPCKNSELYEQLEEEYKKWKEKNKDK